MKTLFYNPIERAKKIHIISKTLNIDKIYDGHNCGFRTQLDELLKMAQLSCFDDIIVYLTTHNEAYIRPKRYTTEKQDIEGWISLKGVKDGGGYLEDKMKKEEQEQEKKSESLFENICKAFDAEEKLN